MQERQQWTHFNITNIDNITQPTISHIAVWLFILVLLILNIPSTLPDEQDAVPPIIYIYRSNNHTNSNPKLMIITYLQILIFFLSFPLLTIFLTNIVSNANWRYLLLKMGLILNHPTSWATLPYHLSDTILWAHPTLHLLDLPTEPQYSVMPYQLSILSNYPTEWATLSIYPTEWATIQLPYQQNIQPTCNTELSLYANPT